MHGSLCQPGGDRFVVGCGIVCRDKTAAVRTIDAAVCKIDAVLLRTPAGARRHHAEAEALYLLRQQAAAVKFPGGIAVALTEHGAGQRVDGIGDLAEQTGEVRFARHGCIAAQHGTVFFILPQPPEPTGGTPREAVNSSRSQSNSVSSVQTVTGGSGWSSGRT